MTELEDRVRELLEERASRATVSPAAWERIEERLKPRRAPRARWRPTAPRLAIALGTAAVVALAVVGGRQLLVDDLVVSVDPLAPEITNVRPGPSAGWERVEGPLDPPAGTGGLAVHDVHADDAVVLVAATGGNLWRADASGERFERIDEAAFTSTGGVVADLLAVAGTPEGYLVVGGTTTRGAVWRSDVSVRFEDVEVPDVGPLADVEAAGDTAVAVGRDATGGVVLVSQDAGRSWQRAELEDRATVEAMSAVTHGPDGWVAAGFEDGPTGGTTLWHSEDGQRWEAVHRFGVKEGRFETLGADEQGYHALRSGGVMNTSPDGRDWGLGTFVGTARQLDPDAEDPKRLRFAGLARVEEGWLVVAGEPGLDTAPQAFRSATGGRWEDEPIDGRGEAHALAVLADGTPLAVGRDDACHDRVSCPDHEHDLRVWRDTR